MSENDFLIGCISVVLIIGSIIAGIVISDKNSNEADIEQQKTERVRIETCVHIEDEALRILCIHNIKEP